MRGHVRLIAARGLDPRGLGKARLWHGRKFSSIVLAVVFAASAFTYSAAAPGSVAAAGCYTNVQTGPAKYKIERQLIYIDGTGDAFLKFNGTICYNGSTAYVQNGSPDSWVANRTGLVPSISRGVFTDGGGTVHVWTDMKFTRSAAARHLSAGCSSGSGSTRAGAGVTAGTSPPTGNAPRRSTGADSPSPAVRSISRGSRVPADPRSRVTASASSHPGMSGST
jgi:hypothetical protein